MSIYKTFKSIEAKQMLKEKAMIESYNSELNFNYWQQNAYSINPTVNWNEENSPQFKFF